MKIISEKIWKKQDEEFKQENIIEYSINLCFKLEQKKGKPTWGGYLRCMKI